MTERPGTMVTSCNFIAENVRVEDNAVSRYVIFHFDEQATLRLAPGSEMDNLCIIPREPGMTVYVGMNLPRWKKAVIRWLIGAPRRRCAPPLARKA